MGDPTTFVIRIDSDELARWREGADKVAEEQHAEPNISALVRRAMATELRRLGVPVDKPKRGAR